MRMANRSFLLALAAAIFSGLVVGCGGSPLSLLPDAPLTNVAGDDATTANLDTAAAIPSDDCLMAGEPSDQTHKAVFEALNKYRVDNGLEPLAYSVRLEMAANAHVKDLYERDYFAHINPDGENPGKRAVRMGFCHEYVGENIAAGQKTVEAVQKAWENSPSHNENMLQTGYKYVGIGVYQDPTGRMYWAQEMAYRLP